MIDGDITNIIVKVTEKLKILARTISKEIYEETSVEKCKQQEKTECQEYWLETWKQTNDQLSFKYYKEKRLHWVKMYIKIDFSLLSIFIEYRTTLDGPDDKAKSWVLNGNRQPVEMNYNAVL